MQTKRFVHLKWTLTLVALVVSSRDPIGFETGEMTAGAYAQEAVSPAGSVRSTTTSHPKIVAATTGLRIASSSGTQISQDISSNIKNSQFVPAGYELMWQEEFN